MQKAPSPLYVALESRRESLPPWNICLLLSVLGPFACDTHSLRRGIPCTTSLSPPPGGSLPLALSPAVPQQSPAGSSWREYASAWAPAPRAKIGRGAVLPRGAVTETGTWSRPLVQDKSKTLSPAYLYPKFFPPFSSFDPSLNMCVWEKERERNWWTLWQAKPFAWLGKAGNITSDRNAGAQFHGFQEVWVRPQRWVSTCQTNEKSAAGSPSVEQQSRHSIYLPFGSPFFK